MDRLTLKNDLKRDEGVRYRPYKDSVGILTIGVGRNLEEVGLFEDEVDLMLENDISRVEKGLDIAYPQWRDFDDSRQNVIANMAFNLGVSGLLKFRKMISALERHDYETAAKEMMDSKWAQQVGVRAIRLADRMKNG